VILAGRRIKDSTGEYVAREGVRLMLKAFGQVRPTLQLGLTFKEDVPDLRNSIRFKSRLIVAAGPAKISQGRSRARRRVTMQQT
jgi:UDP-N-acetyl-D-mannosaminuronate dehydrogenase